MKITIFGLAGSGTSTVGKMLAESLDYPLMSTGNIFRQFAQDAGMSLYEFENTVAKDDLNFDIKLDKQTESYGQENENFIFESRLAWNFIPDSYKIYLDCEEDERYRRIHEREGGSIADIEQANRKRESELNERYSRVYPDITFPPDKEQFDLVIDATSQNPEEILSHILNALPKGNSTS